MFSEVVMRRTMTTFPFCFVEIEFYLYNQIEKMSKFLNHKSLSKEIISLFEDAEEEITIVSPFIKMHPDIKKVLMRKMSDQDFYIKVLFGKNEGDLSKSLSHDDLEFFKGFQNVYIHYQENLHAKYYANETKSIISSINLHEYSINNNIEVGILLERKHFNTGGDNTIDSEAFDYFGEIFEKSTPVFVKEVKKKKVLFGLFEKNVGTEIHEDNQHRMYQKNPSLANVTNHKIGYCIRTGEKISFNPEKPFSAEAFKCWNQYKNKDFKEKYCHYSGEFTNGQTSFARPILAKYYKKSLEY